MLTAVSWKSRFGWLARNTGSASAETSGFANSGVINELHFHAPSGARSGFLAKVREIAPGELMERSAELAEMRAFCAGDAGVPYLWWRASAWAGKTALMSWFALHPPAGVRIVAFFITARYVGQNDRHAFVDVVVEQLAALLGETAPSAATDAAREAHFLDLLGRAAAFCHRRSERLILLVDGLDEDVGVTKGANAHSIAALLPRQPPAGLRVIVSGRPQPPLATDVPDGHPLRDPAIVRPLPETRYGLVVRQDAERELERLLDGTSLEQDLLGLVTAAGGGLSGTDLAQLTGRPARVIQRELNVVAGRTFTGRTARWDPGTQVYHLAHEELQQRAAAALGDDRMEFFLDRIHAWAERHGDEHWPDSTPEYLLRSYPVLLRSLKNADRLVMLATDLDRHDRLAEVSGGDALALREIDLAGDVLHSQEPVGLAEIARLATHRTYLSERNMHVPENLPVVWAKLGFKHRAEAMALSIPGSWERGQALSAIAGAACASGDLDYARAILGLTSDEHVGAQILGGIARAVAVAGDLGEAVAVARSITNDHQRTFALMDIAAECAKQGDLWGAEAIADSFTEEDPVRWTLARLAGPFAVAGELPKAEAMIQRLALAQDRVDAMIGMADAFITVDDPALAHRHAIRARASAAAIPDAFRRISALTDVTGVLAKLGRVEDAVALARSFEKPYDQARAMAKMVSAVASRGGAEVVHAAIRRAEMAIRVVEDQQHQRWASFELLGAVSGMDDASVVSRVAEDALQVVLAEEDLISQASQLAQLASMLVDAGQLEAAREMAVRAQTVARCASDSGYQIRRLARLAVGCAKAGSPQRGRHFAARAEALVRSADQRDAYVLGEVAESWAALEDRGRAEQLAESITGPLVQVRALYGLVRQWPRQRLGEVRSVVARAESVARSADHPAERAEALARASRAFTILGDSRRAVAALAAAREAFALIEGPLSFNGEQQRDEALSEIAEASCDMGHVVEAWSIAASVANPYVRSGTMETIALALARRGALEQAREAAADIGLGVLRSKVLADIAVLTGQPDARQMIAVDVLYGPWHIFLEILASVDQAAVLALTDEYLRIEGRLGPAG